MSVSDKMLVEVIQAAKKGEGCRIGCLQVFGSRTISIGGGALLRYYGNDIWRFLPGSVWSDLPGQVDRMALANRILAIHGVDDVRYDVQEVVNGDGRVARTAGISVGDKRYTVKDLTLTLSSTANNIWIQFLPHSPEVRHFMRRTADCTPLLAEQEQGKEP